MKSLELRDVKVKCIVREPWMDFVNSSIDCMTVKSMAKHCEVAGAEGCQGEVHGRRAVDEVCELYQWL